MFPDYGWCIHIYGQKIKILYQRVQMCWCRSLNLPWYKKCQKTIKAIANLSLSETRLFQREPSQYHCCQCPTKIQNVFGEMFAFFVESSMCYFLEAQFRQTKPLQCHRIISYSSIFLCFCNTIHSVRFTMLLCLSISTKMLGTRDPFQ